MGRHVVQRLRSQGREVAVADLVPYRDREVWTTVGDLCDPDVRAAAVRPGTSAVVHLAAATSVLGSLRSPEHFHRSNVEMTAALLELARVRAVPAFVLASTNAVVGDVGRRTITEDLAPAPLTPYGAGKAAAEMLAMGYAGGYGIRCPLVRFGNVYGRGMAHKDSLVPRLLRAAAADSGIEVYGDGEQQRDLVHVRDVVQAIELALAGWPTGPVIVGAGRSFSVNEIVQAARHATGRAIPATHVAAKPGEMPAVILDVSRARARGYAPLVGLVEGLADAWADDWSGARVDGRADERADEATTASVRG